MGNDKITRRLTLVGFGLSGAAALIYEVVWFRALSLILGSTTYALSTMLSAFMAGLALGSFIGGKLADRIKNPIMGFGFMELGIAIFGLLTLPIIKNLSPLYAWIFYTFNMSFSGFSIAQFALAFLVMIIPTTLMGATFPVVLKARAGSLERLGTDGGEIYSVNTVGAVIGSMSAGFLLIPLLGSTKANLFAATLNFIVALAILGRYRASRTFRLGLPIFLIAGLASQAIPHPVRPFNYYYAYDNKSYSEYYESIKDNKVVFSKEDVNGRVLVFMMKQQIKFLVNGSKVESAEVGIDVPNTYLLAYLPAAYHKNPKTFLNIGLGTGTTVKAASGIKDLRKIDSVEISPSVMEAVEKEFFPELFNNKKINHIKADARNYLILADKKYDIISSEPSYTTDESVSHLFTEEFFRLVRSRLSEDGVFAQWVPYYLLEKEGMNVMVKTFASVFPDMSLWRSDKRSEDYILIGTVKKKSPQKVKRQITGKFKKSALLRDFRPEFISDEFPERLAEDASVPLNTDDRPVISFFSAKNQLL